MKIHDFRLLADNSGNRYTIVTNEDGSIKYIQVADTTMTLDMFQELVQRVQDFVEGNDNE